MTAAAWVQWLVFLLLLLLLVLVLACAMDALLDGRIKVLLPIGCVI